MLTETWTNQNMNIDIEGYNCHALHRQYKKRNTKRDSGGIAFYVKQTIDAGVKIIKTDSDDIMWLKLCSNFFGMASDILLCLCYTVPENSSRNDIIQQDVFDRIQRHITEFKSTYDANDRDVKFCVAGDMNGRTGCLPDYVVHDISKNLSLPDDYIEDNGLDLPHRTNSDKMINNYGRLLLELCKTCSLRILNGRAGTDRGVGKWTCTKHNGPSVVDYVACTADLYDSIVSFYDIIKSLAKYVFKAFLLRSESLHRG